MVTPRSVSTASSAPKAAAVRPARPAPAPSSATRRPLTSPGCDARYAEKALAAGQTKKPVQSSPTARLRAAPPSAPGSCSRLMGPGSAGCSKCTICSPHMGPEYNSLSMCCAVNASGGASAAPSNEGLAIARSRLSRSAGTMWMQSSRPSLTASRRSRSTRDAVAKDTETRMPWGCCSFRAMACRQSSVSSGLSMASSVPLSRTTAAEPSSVPSS
mmetsp:Transcript_80593/g.240231  ORF Transcript_80593/g.240231 Transcript_80593/m.240231 type:complete len:215 (+) Transcript_80593:471-1115(+)